MKANRVLILDTAAFTRIVGFREESIEIHRSQTIEVEYEFRCHPGLRVRLVEIP